MIGVTLVIKFFRGSGLSNRSTTRERLGVDTRNVFTIAFTIKVLAVLKCVTSVTKTDPELFMPVIRTIHKCVLNLTIETIWPKYSCLFPCFDQLYVTTKHEKHLNVLKVRQYKAQGFMLATLP